MTMQRKHPRYAIYIQTRNIQLSQAHWRRLLAMAVIAGTMTWASSAHADTLSASACVISPGSIIDGADTAAAFGKRNGDGFLASCASWGCPLGTAFSGFAGCVADGYLFNGWVMISGLTDCATTYNHLEIDIENRDYGCATTGCGYETLTYVFAGSISGSTIVWDLVLNEYTSLNQLETVSQDLLGTADVDYVMIARADAAANKPDPAWYEFRQTCHN